MVYLVHGRLDVFELHRLQHLAHRPSDLPHALRNLQRNGTIPGGKPVAVGRVGLMPLPHHCAQGWVWECLCSWGHVRKRQSFAQDLMNSD